MVGRGEGTRVAGYSRRLGPCGDQGVGTSEGESVGVRGDVDRILLSAAPSGHDGMGECWISETCLSTAVCAQQAFYL